MADAPQDGDSVVVCRVDDYMQADLIVKVLRDEGIPAALVTASPSAGITGTVTLGDGIDSAPWACFAVLTTLENAERAREIVEEWRNAAPQAGS